MAYTDYSGVDMATGGGLASLLSTIHGLYPQARVTSGYRGPNNPLTQRNPSSMHAMGSPSDPRAVDVAPIPGLKFNDYVSSVKNAGVPIAQAFDEASHPFPWTTGPNWHLASADQPAGNTDPAQGPYYNPPSGGSQPMPPQKPMSLGAMAQNLPGYAPKQSKFTAGNIMGVLGDALSAYGGKAPTFAPFMREQQLKQQDQSFEREKFQQELAMKMYSYLHPEEMLKAEAFQSAPQAVRQSMVDYANTMDPKVVGVQQPNGSIVNQVQPRQLNYQVGDIHPGTDGNYMFMGGDATSQASWKKVQ